jgi:2',3'-cyclic-nucleotide 2'-phosphodiesterase/3'-nucleotidase
MEENAALHLAKLDGIDVILTGHQHLVFPGGKAFDGIDGVDNVKGSLHGKPACQPGFWGSHLGIIDLDLEKRGERWRDRRFQGRAAADLRAHARPQDRAQGRRRAAMVLAAVMVDHEATLSLYARAGRRDLAAPINSFFALVADDPSMQIVADAQIGLCQGADGADADTRRLPVLSAAAPFKSGGRAGPAFFTDIPAGPIAIKNVADIYLYPNTVQIVKMTGAQVREWLERSAGIFNRIDPAKDRGAATDQPGLPGLQFRRDRRRHLSHRCDARPRAMTATASSQRPMRTASSISPSRAGRSTRPPSSSS